jgi:signal transduction histidine kinase
VDKATEEVLAVARTVLEELDVELVLERVLDAARELTGARYAALGVLDESQRELGRFLVRGIDAATRQSIGPLPTGRGVLGELIRSPQPLRIDDLGGHPLSYGFPVGHPPMSSFLGVPIAIGGKPYGNLYLTEKQGGVPFSEADEEATVLLAEFAALAIDHAARYTRSEQERERVQRTVQSLDATIQISRALGSETDLDAILKLVAKRARALVAARVAMIELLHGEELVLAAGAGELPERLLGRRFSLGDTVASTALRSGITQRLSDQLNRARFDQHGAGALGLTVDEGLVVPLVFRNRAYGVLVVLDHLQAGEFTAEHQRLLESFAASVAIAVATAQTVADERHRQRLAAAEAERSRWARELHDETLQALGSLRLVLSSGRRGGQETMADAVEQALAQLTTDIANLRALIAELRPAALDQLGLEPALLALIERVGRVGLEIDSHVELMSESGNSSERLEPDLETGVYRIVQEALTNAVKHGNASRASVEVIEDASHISLTVRDDGSGFDPTAHTEGFGLAGMRERVELLGGTISVISQPSQGTAVAVEVPVRRRGQGAARPTQEQGTGPVPMTGAPLQASELRR